MSKNTRAYETDMQVLPALGLQTPQIRDNDRVSLASSDDYLDEIQLTIGGYEFSRKMILRLIEWFEEA